MWRNSSGSTSKGQSRRTSAAKWGPARLGALRSWTLAAPSRPGKPAAIAGVFPSSRLASLATRPPDLALQYPAGQPGAEGHRQGTRRSLRFPDRSAVHCLTMPPCGGPPGVILNLRTRLHDRRQCTDIEGRQDVKPRLRESRIWFAGKPEPSPVEATAGNQRRVPLLPGLDRKARLSGGRIRHDPVPGPSDRLYDSFSQHPTAILLCSAGRESQSFSKLENDFYICGMPAYGK